MKLLIALVLLLAGGCNAYADLSVRDYQNMKKAGGVSRDLVQAHAAAVGRGIYAANIWLRVNKRDPIFCYPDDLTMDSMQFNMILDDAIRKNKMGDSYPVELLLVTEIAYTYNCNRQ